MSERHTYWYDVGFHNRKAMACYKCTDDGEQKCDRPYQWIPVSFKYLDPEDFKAYHSGYDNNNFRENMECE